MYKEKYEQALAYIKNMQTENDIKSEEKQKTSSEAMENNIHVLCENFLANKRDSLAFYEAIDSPLGKIVGREGKTTNQNSAESRVNEFNITENLEPSEAIGDLTTENKFILLSKLSANEKIENEINLTAQNHQFSNQEQLITKAYKARKMQMLEKLKEEYHNLVEDKKNLENKIAEYVQKEKEFAEITKRNENLSLMLEIANEKTKCLEEQNKAILERNNKITFENYEITNTNNQLKESLKYLEKERLQNKNKINSNFNKVKLYEKENNASKKKLTNLNTNLKNLTDKLNASVQEKEILEKKMEDLKQEYENKITNLMLEQQKIVKDSFLTTLTSLEEKKIPLEFFYEEEKNSLTIMLEDIVISEFTNLRISKIDKAGNIQEIKTAEELSPRKATVDNQEHMNNSITSNIRLENADFVKSPSNRSSLMNINNENIFNNNQNNSGSNHKNNKIDLESLLSLNKILSGSSKKSFTNTNTKRILMSNFSSAKKISAFHEENNSNNICTAFSNVPSEAFNNPINQLALNKALIHNGSNNFQSFTNYLTNFNSSMKVIPEEIDPKNYFSSVKENINFNDACNQNSNISKVFNMTTNKNYYGENNTSLYENDRYSGMNFSAKKKSRVSNLMSGKKNNNINENNFKINENDENENPNIQSHLQCENSIVRIRNSKENENLSLVSNAKSILIEESGNKNESTKKPNGRGNNLSLVGKKAFNNNNFEKCIKNININTEQINNINRDDIKKIINTASSTRHRKMISLDEALNLEEICDKETLNNEAAINYGSYNSNNFIQQNTNLKGFNYFSTNKNEEAKSKHFDFNSQQIESFLNKALNLEENLNLADTEHKQTEKESFVEDPKNDGVSKKIEFDTEGNFEKILKRRRESNLIENVVTDFIIIHSVKSEEKPAENLPSIAFNRGFMIDSNVNLITINSMKKSYQAMITSENKFDLISIKDKKFIAQKLQLFQNERIDISQATKPIIKNEKTSKIKVETKKLLIIKEENFCLNEEVKEAKTNISQPKEEIISNKQSFADKNLEVEKRYLFLSLLI